MVVWGVPPITKETRITKKYKIYKMIMLCLHTKAIKVLPVGPFKPSKLNIRIPIILLLGQYLVAKLIWEIISETSKY